jgi:hypothetical protein
MLGIVCVKHNLEKPVLFGRTKDSQRLQWRRNDGHAQEEQRDL